MKPEAKAAPATHTAAQPVDAAARILERLDREFRGRLRLRWSNRKQEFQLEQKVRRALAEGPVKDSQDDDGIRRRDGYLYVLQEHPGDDLREKVLAAADLCPTAAITVTD